MPESSSGAVNEVNSPPKVSVVMSVYNAASYVGQAIEGILKQTFDRFEFIILNDGSTDASGSIITSYTDPRITYIEQDNVGLGSSLNKGISLSRGQYIARIDADDVALPSRLAKQVDFLDSNPACSLLGTACYVIDERDKVMFVMRHPSHDVHLRWSILFDNPFVHSSVMFRRSTYDAIGPYGMRAGLYAEDYDLWSRFMSHYRAANLDEPLLLYRHNPAGVSQTKRVSQESQTAETSTNNISSLLQDEHFTLERGLQIRYVRGANWPHPEKERVETAVNDLRLIHSRFAIEHSSELNSLPDVARAIDRDFNRTCLAAAAGLATCGARSSGFRVLGRVLKAKPAFCLSLRPWGTVAMLMLGPPISGMLLDAIRRRNLRRLGLGKI